VKPSQKNQHTIKAAANARNSKGVAIQGNEKRPPVTTLSLLTTDRIYRRRSEEEIAVAEEPGCLPRASQGVPYRHTSASRVQAKRQQVIRVRAKCKPCSSQMQALCMPNASQVRAKCKPSASQVQAKRSHTVIRACQVQAKCHKVRRVRATFTQECHAVRKGSP
jgi:hypothetical protein